MNDTIFFLVMTLCLFSTGDQIVECCGHKLWISISSIFVTHPSIHSQPLIQTRVAGAAAFFLCVFYIHTVTQLEHTVSYINMSFQYRASVGTLHRKLESQQILLNYKIWYLLLICVKFIKQFKSCDIENDFFSFFYHDSDKCEWIQRHRTHHVW